MRIQIGWHLGLDLIKKLTERLGAMARIAFAADHPDGDV
jgi:hypothetical protein